MRKLYFYFCAWNRACELYAQLNGSVTDYGVEHFARCGHLRYGRDFSKNCRKILCAKKRWTCRLRLFFQRMVFIKTISARAPSHSPSKLFTSDSEIEKVSGISCRFIMEIICRFRVAFLLKMILPIFI